jgi:hypothetical protein
MLQSRSALFGWTCSSRALQSQATITSASASAKPCSISVGWVVARSDAQTLQLKLEKEKK